MCMGVPVLSPQGSPAVLGVLGYPVLTPPLCLAVCILCLLPALPTWPWDPPGPPGWVSLPWGHCLGMGGAMLSPLTAASIAWGRCWAGAARSHSEPPRLPRDPGVLLSVGSRGGAPGSTHIPPWGRAGAPGGSYGVILKTLATSCSSPGHGPAAPIPRGVSHCPSSCGGPHPMGFPVPQGSPALGGRQARAGPSNADFVSLSPL